MRFADSDFDYNERQNFYYFTLYLKNVLSSVDFADLQRN